MKNITILKTNSIHPIYNGLDWIYLLMPVSIMEGVNFSGKAFCSDTQPIVTAFYLN